MDVPVAVGCVMALSTGWLIWLVGMTALKQKDDEVLVRGLLPVEGLFEVYISPTTLHLQSLEEEIRSPFLHCPNHAPSLHNNHCTAAQILKQTACFPESF